MTVYLVCAVQSADYDLIEAGTGVIVGLSNEIREVIQEGGEVLISKHTITGPELRFDGPGVDSIMSDNTIIGRAVFQGPEEIRVLGFIGMNDVAGAQHDLVVDNIVGSNAVYVGKEGETA